MSDNSAYVITVLVFLRVPQTVIFKFNISSKRIYIYLRLTCFKQLNNIKLNHFYFYIKRNKND